jgi:Dyp-type peroxidase family
MASENSSRNLRDTDASAPINWQLGGPKNQTIHAIVILNALTETALGKECERLELGLAKFVRIRIVARESGRRPTDNKEPFGFRDGIAQPKIKGIKGVGVNTGEFLLGYPNEYDFLPVTPVVPASADPKKLLPDSANPFLEECRDLGTNGTFLVYRKLEQDVAGFWNFMRVESERRLGVGDPLFMVRLASKMVGRWPSGAPLSLTPQCDNPALSDADDFHYARIDPQGLGCPFGAHIRRSNPRDQLRPAGPLESRQMTLRHRILRRGKPYGSPLFDLGILDNLRDQESLEAILNLRDDGQPRGIHFLCINANIKSQFQFIQQAWCNNPHFNGLTNNPDPLTGSSGSGDSPGSMFVPLKGLPLRTGQMPRFVTVRGGSYFFMPSLRALKWLAE